MSKHTKRAQQGFSLLEMIVVVGLAFTVMAFAVMNTMSSSQNARGASAMDAVISQLRQARELAIARRRNVQVQFTAPNQIQLTILTLPGEPIPTAIAPTFLNDGVAGGYTFTVFASLPDTPMGFGNSTAINLQQPTGGGTWTCMFTTSGAFVGTAQSAASLYQATNNNPVNASIFLGIAGKPNTARAVTVFGATGRVRSYNWSGSSWNE
ncbi:MAG TPA: prepilin-type N-terminal cleavage/methylation domain-containing protein [Candidatus Acidoferrum sp.]|jgi:prepilin-type N-terminal cleavage/methylation domain-containing protein